MPDHTTLKIGDRIRLLRVPQPDLDQRDRERLAGTPAAGWTADTIERVIAVNPVVTISSVDEYGLPWFECELTSTIGEIEHHSLAVMDDEPWRPAYLWEPDGKART